MYLLLRSRNGQTPCARFILYFFLLFFHLSFSQEGNIGELLNQSENALYSDPHKAIRIAEYVSKKSENPEQLQKAAYLLTQCFYMEGNYNEALEVGLKFSSYEFQNDSDTQLKLDMLISKILNDLGLNKIATKYVATIVQNSANKDENLKFWLNGKILQYNIGSDYNETSTENFKRIYSAKKELQKINGNKPTAQIGNINLEIASLHLREFQLDSVPYYLDIAYAESKKKQPKNYLEMKCLEEYGNYFFLKKQYAVAIDSLKSALTIAENFTNIAEQITISKSIANNYLALNDLKNFNIQNDKTQLLNDSETDVENEAVNSTFNFISESGTERVSKTRAYFKKNIIIFSGILILVLLFWGFLEYRYCTRIKQYQTFIDYSKKKTEPAIPKKQKTIKPNVVPKEMEEILLEKLTVYENSTDFTNQDTSLSRLALQFDTNTKYLSEVINLHKQKNFNGYINELRINYIIDKLKNDPAYLKYKISYLAEDSGFSSHSIFATVFKSVTGIPPTTFITILKDKQEITGKSLVKNGN